MVAAQRLHRRVRGRGAKATLTPPAADSLGAGRPRTGRSHTSARVDSLLCSLPSTRPLQHRLSWFVLLDYMQCPRAWGFSGIRRKFDPHVRCAAHHLLGIGD